ncbi:hypothetical protein KV205_31190 [Streptomyces sp. SKN60]|uniref:hypothetical protein n=1 Tax=Streptomyces sp. SKN60 TaxID=2855506 RepID=UPI002245EB60|nr:hypothetical protein [Streptomyces sp. SKN60]MCX2184959.1 hypothetical protein [Streptomyces sp. SKN60]
MRPHASSRITALAISAALTLGMAGPAFADEHRPSGPAAHAGTRAPLPDSAALLAQAQALGELGSVSTPVTELITATLKADDGQLPAADAEAFKEKITTALEAAKETAPVTPPETPVTPPAAETPVTPPAVETPATSPVTSAVTTPVTSVVPTGVRAAAPADIVGDALATVQKAVADLLAAVTSGNATGVVPQVTATLTSLVNLAVATVLGSGLPAPNLAGLPTLPSLPVSTDTLPVKPPVSTDTLPVTPPVSTGALPVR